jgi:hypothetical protein
VHAWIVLSGGKERKVLCKIGPLYSWDCERNTWAEVKKAMKKPLLKLERQRLIAPDVNNGRSSLFLFLSRCLEPLFFLFITC